MSSHQAETPTKKHLVRPHQSSSVISFRGKTTTNASTGKLCKIQGESKTSQTIRERALGRKKASTAAAVKHPKQKTLATTELLSPIVITISQDGQESREVGIADQVRESMGEREGTNLKKIMDNFIAVVNPDLKELTRDINLDKNIEENCAKLEKVKIEPSCCVDFGIADYLCQGSKSEDEVEVDIASDTDSSYMEANPPNRFSDSDIDGIEPLSITIETILNPSKAIVHKIELPKAGENVWTDTRIKLIPRKPFRRHISLPPSLFMSRFFGNRSGENSPVSQEVTLIVKSAGTSKPGPFLYPRFSRLESISSADMESFDKSGYCVKSMSSWSMSVENGSEGEDVVEQAFTSDIEKRALAVRGLRRLVRQDTTVGNFAPPHYCNT